MVQFFLTLVGAVAALSVASVGWPLASSAPRPLALEKVYSVVSQTPAGGQLATLLGVTENTQPINVASVAGNVAGAVSSTVQKKTQEAITSRLVTELIEEYDGLPDDQKQQIHEAICQEPLPTPVVE